MKGTQEEELPRRFDEDVVLEIEDGSDRKRPLVRMTDTQQDAAWVSASIDAVISLSEYR
ncbi:MULTISPECIES: hypothetical protein [unclassified Haladaptatus]|uniref:hypothetical protein n=1 Tax=unclassified Haladaptatus TaxID=2622732 RepID=UPI00209C05C4|nr:MULTISPECIES: hypothetical protein [unclassified Haladaptatus]MCO8242531.1 hypothetical protein [Haladaptatus sp. AB643]MCO8252288.1 hypothetical protein [Haladaptatus sp. AB618]